MVAPPTCWLKIFGLLLLATLSTSSAVASGFTMRNCRCSFCLNLFLYLTCVLWYSAMTSTNFFVRALCYDGIAMRRRDRDRQIFGTWVKRILVRLSWGLSLTSFLFSLSISTHKMLGQDPALRQCQHVPLMASFVVVASLLFSSMSVSISLCVSTPSRSRQCTMFHVIEHTCFLGLGHGG